MSLHSYPSIFAIGHSAIGDLLSHEVIVEEKVDGSQISFGLIEGELFIRSRGAKIQADAPEGMFANGVKAIQEIKALLTEGWTYRGEYLSKPKHNTLAYSRTPKNYIILFDINSGLEVYLSPEEKRAEAERIGLECVPQLFQGKIESPTHLRELLRFESVLGGQNIEGVVVKPVGYSLFGRDKKALLGKYVSETFKEKHIKDWKNSNPTQNDVIVTLGQTYNSEVRWQKAIQHLRDDGKLEGSPRDIGPLIQEIPADILKDSEQEIKNALFAWAWPHIRRHVIRGFPEWYKQQLMEQGFVEPPVQEPSPAETRQESTVSHD
jgi:hypothetical protein